MRRQRLGGLRLAAAAGLVALSACSDGLVDTGSYSPDGVGDVEASAALGLGSRMEAAGKDEPACKHIETLARAVKGEIAGAERAAPGLGTSMKSAFSQWAKSFGEYDRLALGDLLERFHGATDDDPDEPSVNENELIAIQSIFVHHLEAAGVHAGDRRGFLSALGLWAKGHPDEAAELLSNVAMLFADLQQCAPLQHQGEQP